MDSSPRRSLLTRLTLKLTQTSLRLYFYQGLFGAGPASELFPKAKANAVRALQLDETVAAAHNALAAIHILYEWDWAAAEAECMRAMQLSPSDSVTHFHLADYMSIRARHDEAIAEFRLALELDPISCIYLGFSDSSCIGHGGMTNRSPNARKLWKSTLTIRMRYGFWLSRWNKRAGSTNRSRNSKRPSAFRADALPGVAGSRVCAGRREDEGAGHPRFELKALSQRRYVSPFDLPWSMRA